MKASEKKAKLNALKRELSETQRKIEIIRKDLQRTAYSQPAVLFSKAQAVSKEFNELLRTEEKLKSEIADLNKDIEQFCAELASIIKK